MSSTVAFEWFGISAWHLFHMYIYILCALYCPQGFAGGAILQQHGSVMIVAKILKCVVFVQIDGIKTPSTKATNLLH